VFQLFHSDTLPIGIKSEIHGQKNILAYTFYSAGLFAIWPSRSWQIRWSGSNALFNISISSCLTRTHRNYWFITICSE